jgi:hypothetical protein
MKTEMRRESSKYQAAADELLTEVSQLLAEAEITMDISNRHKIYRQAMEKNTEAYELIAKARELAKKEV